MEVAIIANDRVSGKRQRKPKQYPKEIDLERMLKAAWSVCSKKYGFDLTDIEYESAINEGVLIAADTWKPNSGRTPITLAVKCARKCCVDVRNKHKKWATQDKIVAKLDKTKPELPQLVLDTPELEVAIAILEHVAKYGITEGAKLLSMSRQALKERLDLAAFQVSQARLRQSD